VPDAARHSLNRGLAAAALALGALALLVPDAALAGAGGAELNDIYVTLTGWMTGLLGRVIAVTMIIVGIVAGVARQSIMGFVMGIAAGLGMFTAPGIIDAVVSATLPVLP
jgi:conjugal transfer pilus assembly protein TraA